MTKLFLGLLLPVLLSQSANASETFIKVANGCELRTVIEESPGVPTNKDVLFFTGFGDRADNHGPLFRELTKTGARVISFDYPSHGETRCGSLNEKSFETLSDYVETLERNTRVDPKRPLFVTGWSTGGLLALRMIQNNRLAEREPAGLVMLAPGISVHKFVGGDGIVRTETLTSNPNPPHKGAIKPVSPFLVPFFSMKIAANAILSRKSERALPIPSLIIVAGDTEDLYVKTGNVKEWYFENKSANFFGFQCESSKHELDNEIEPIGSEVRALFAQFLSDKNTQPASGKVCKTL